MATTTERRSSSHAMDRIYRHQRHIYDLTRKYYLLGRDRLIRDLRPGHGDSVLEIGCGTARNLIKVAKRYPEARCFGVDISRAMLATAEHSIARKGLNDRIRLVRGDATNLDGAALVGEPLFDRVFISYSLSMMPSWRMTLERALRALAPGGRLVIVDFGDLAGWPGWFRAAFLRWLALFQVCPREDLADVAARLAGMRGCAIVARSLYRGYARYLIIERPGAFRSP
ncbi:MAG: class I SAM-dependent methyltransferase [Rhodospirillaceae bacterium]|nr:class I SAM-dependent methyltransferase [Rhodospirillaceae bacterium]